MVDLSPTSQRVVAVAITIEKSVGDKRALGCRPEPLRPSWSHLLFRRTAKATALD